MSVLNVDWEFCLDDAAGDDNIEGNNIEAPGRLSFSPSAVDCIAIDTTCKVGATANGNEEETEDSLNKGSTYVSRSIKLHDRGVCIAVVFNTLPPCPLVP